MTVRLPNWPGEEPAKRRAGGKGNKFGAQRAGCHHHHTHDSIAEARRCNDLHLLARAGKIRNLVQQPRFRFVINGVQVRHPGSNRPVIYTADFGYDEEDSRIGWRAVVEDVKGRYRDDAWRLRKAFFVALHPDVTLREVK